MKSSVVAVMELVLRVRNAKPAQSVETFALTAYCASSITNLQDKMHELDEITYLDEITRNWFTSFMIDDIFTMDNLPEQILDIICKETQAQQDSEDDIEIIEPQEMDEWHERTFSKHWFGQSHRLSS